MSQKIHKVVIGNVEYKLTSENEETLRKAVELVNHELEELNKQTGVKLALTQSYVLVSLNIAEKLVALQNQLSEEKVYLTTELSKITDLLEEKVNR